MTGSAVPARVLGPVSATCVVVGAIVGVGIFFTPARVAADAGSTSAALMAWGLGGALAALGALVFAELGGLESGPGAQYRVLRDAFGRLPGFLYGFINLTTIQAGALAIIAWVFLENVGAALGVTFTPIVNTLLAVSTIGGLTVANGLGVRWGARIQNVTTFAKIGTLLAITVLAIVAGDPPPSKPTVVEVARPAGFLAALLPVLFSFGGWQQALWISGEVKRPERNLPLAILVGVGLVIVTYECVVLAYFGLLGFEGVARSGTLAADAVGAVLGSGGSRAVAAAVALSALGVMNAQLLTGPRFVFAMAADGAFLSACGRLHPRYGTPLVGIVILGGLASTLLVLAGTSGAGLVLDAVVFVDWVFYALTGLALFRLRRLLPDAPRPFRVPGHPVTTAAFVGGALLVVVATFAEPTKRATAGVGVAWILVGALIYAIWIRRRLRPTGA